MSFGTITQFSKPRPPKVRKAPSIKKVGRKGEFWLFVSKILTEFFFEIDMPRRCEKCDGSRYGGPIQPAHSRRRVDIRVDDWWYALRVAVLCNDCHFEADSKGRRDAEPIIEKIITDRFKRMGLSEEKVRLILLACAKKVQEQHSPKFDQFLVIL